ncbi:hypothetical protein [Leptospira idonii]|uniref:Lipoprotein n=1 Tax=Leptospira idonii TaxID=1193500 RepID=A0A4R9LWS2_9LEPT|nr:hypothetical protein [Leptospira idonii]TGN18743.1 hypothetical protein EHS15_15350 [Leptospira idonii]
MKLRLSLLILLAFVWNCAGAQEKDASSDGKGGLVETIIEKAQSEEGQKAIQAAKEKLQEKETQDKLKGLVTKEKKK